MILADKIIENRKKNGWSQEELADRLGVSRQSVSKWEGAQAVPDMKKIIQMAEVFGVSTDYLLKDEIETASAPDMPPVDSGLGDEVRQVSMEEASDFLAHNMKASETVSTGVMLCVLSPIPLMILAGLTNSGMLSASDEITGLAGVVILLMIVAVAVGLFITMGLRGKSYEFLENTNIDTEYGVSGMARERRDAYSQTHSRRLVIGIMLCVMAAVPLLVLLMMGYSNNSDLLPAVGVAALLAMVAVGVKLIVMTSIRHGGYDKLLEEGDYTRLGKKAGRFDGIYWGIALAVYLGWSFYNMQWQTTWIVWPIAGVLYFVYHEIMKAIYRSRV